MFLKSTVVIFSPTSFSSYAARDQMRCNNNDASDVNGRDFDLTNI